MSGYVLSADDTGVMSWIANGAGGGGDMLATTYDPTNVAGDAFAMDNMVQGSTNYFVT